MSKKVHCRSLSSIHILYNQALVGGLSDSSDPATRIVNLSLLGGITTSVRKVLKERAHALCVHIRAPAGSWLYSIWIDLEDIQWTFSLKTFVGPTPDPQSHTVRAHGRRSPSATVVLRSHSHRPLTDHIGLFVATGAHILSPASTSSLD